MERLRNATWEDALKAEPTHGSGLTAALLRHLGVFLKVSQTVAYAHAVGHTHRDLKPRNVQVGRRPETGEVWVLDWGLGSHASEAGSAEARPRGTPLYEPPEQADRRADADGKRVDVFLLGGILCELLTGAPPYAGPEGRREDRLAAARQRLAGRRSGLPELVDLALRCLQADPAARPADAGGVANAVDAYLTEAVREAHVTAERLRGERFRRRAAYAIAGLCVAGSVIIAGASSVAIRATEKRYSAEDAKNKADQQAKLDAVRERAATRPPGWTRANRADLTELANRENKSIPDGDLRREAVVALASHDVRPAGSVAAGLPQVACLAFHPTKPLLAAGVGRVFPPADNVVVVADTATGREVARHTFPSAFDLRAPGERDGVRCVGFSPDGRCLVAGTRKGAVRVWDLTASPPRERGWQAHPTFVRELAFTGDGRTLVTMALVGPGKTSLKAWDLDRPGETPVAERAVEADAAYLRFCPGTGRLAAVIGQKLTELDPATLATLRETAVGVAVASPTGDTAARLTGDGGELIALDGRGGGRPLTLADGNPKVFSQSGPVAYTPDGTVFLAQDAQTHRLLGWEVASGRLLFAHPFEQGEGGQALAVSADGRTAAVRAGDRVDLLELVRPSVVRTGALHPEPVTAVSAQAAGLACLDGRTAGRSADLTWWRGHPAEALRPVAARPLEAQPVFYPGRVAASRDGGWLAATDRFTDRSGRIALWRPRGSQPDITVPADSDVGGLAFDPAGRLWAAVGVGIRVVDPAGGRQVAAWSDPYDSLTRENVRYPAVAPVGDGAVVGSTAGTVAFLKPDGAALARTAVRKLGAAVSVVAPAADGRTVGVGTADGRFALLSVPDLAVVVETLEARGAAVAAAAEVEPGLWATGGAAPGVRLWRASAAGLAPAVELPATGPVRQIEAGVSGRSFHTLTHGETAVRTWDLKNLRDRLSEIGPVLREW